MRSQDVHGLGHVPCSTQYPRSQVRPLVGSQSLSVVQVKLSDFRLTRQLVVDSTPSAPSATTARSRMIEAAFITGLPGS
jgi:hypothetical protein